MIFKIIYSLEFVICHSQVQRIWIENTFFDYGTEYDTRINCLEDCRIHAFCGGWVHFSNFLDFNVKTTIFSKYCMEQELCFQWGLILIFEWCYQWYCYLMMKNDAFIILLFPLFWLYPHAFNSWVYFFNIFKI